MTKNEEVLDSLKTIRKRISSNYLCEANKWYGVDSLPRHAYSKGLRDALKEIDDEICEIETAMQKKPLEETKSLARTYRQKEDIFVLDTIKNKHVIVPKGTVWTLQRNILRLVLKNSKYDDMVVSEKTLEDKFERIV